jgi:hypothetical protein
METFMIPVQVEHRLGLLTAFRQEFRAIDLQVHYYAEYVRPLAAEVLAPFRELGAMGAALGSLSAPNAFPFPDQSVSTGEWATITKRYWEREWQEWQQEKSRWFTVPEHLKSVYIWDNKAKRYWYKVFGNLVAWWIQGDCRLEDVSWALEPAAVKLIMRGKGTFDGIRSVTIEGVNHEFWTLHDASGLTNLVTRAFHAALLATPFWAQQGNGLLAADVKENQIVMQLSIPRADIGTPAPEGWPLPIEEAGRIVDEILYWIASGMKEAGQKLEQALSEEINRLSSIAGEKVESDSLGRLYKSLDKLQEVERYLDDWLNDFPYTIEQ